MSNEVIFRRIRGRLVPIKLTKEQKGQVKGASIAAAGAGVSIVGGSTYRKVANKAIDLGIKGVEASQKMKFGSKQMSFDDLLINQGLKKTQLGYSVAAKRVAKLAIGIRKTAPIIGGALIAYGTTKFVNNYGKDKKRKIAPEVAGAIGLAAGVGGAAATVHSKALFDYAAIHGNKATFKAATSGVATGLRSVFVKMLKGL